MISLDVINKRIVVRAIPEASDFEAHRNRLLELSEREALYNDEDDFLGWELPLDCISSVIDRFKPAEIRHSPEGQKLIDEFSIQLTPPEEAPREKLKVSRADGLPLYSYQEDYVCIAGAKTRLLCAFDLGLGKSSSALLRAAQLGFIKLIIVGPKCTLVNWEEEIRKNIGGLRVITYTGEMPKKKRTKLHQNFQTTDAFLVNYEMAGEITEALKEQKIKVQQIIVDEAHLVSRRGKLRNKTVKALLKQYKSAGLQLLSGTPILKNIEDLYELVWMCSPSISGSRSEWLDNFREVVYSQEQTKILNKGTSYERLIKFEVPMITRPKNMEVCHKKIRSILVRIDRNDITDFEDLTEIIRVPMTAYQADLYRQAAQEVLIEWKTGQLAITNVLTRMLRLLQISEGAFNIDEGSNESGKLEYISHVLDNTEDKIIVWSRFKPVSLILYEKYKDQAVLYNGDVNERDKTLAKYAFQGGLSESEELIWLQNRGQTPVSFTNKGKPISYRPTHNGHIKAPGGARFFFGTLDFRSSIGINLHNDCFQQYFMSFHFNGGVNSQAKGRLTRLGQEADKVVTTYLVSQGTIEPDCLMAVLARFKSQQQIVTGNFTYERALGREVIEFLERSVK